jgi:putative hemolysin
MNQEYSMISRVKEPIDIFSLSSKSGGPMQRRVFSLTERLLALDGIRRIYRNMEDADDPETFPAKVLESLRINIDVRGDELKRIPARGPAVIVANHPFGAVEGIALAHLLKQVRPDVKIMANYLLSRIPQMKDLFISVDPFARKDSARKNIAPMRDCLRWVKQGGLLVIFPAGEVSHWDLRHRNVCDPPWNENIARLIRQTGAPVLPVFFAGSNGPLFQAAGLLHPLLRTALLPKELLNRRNKSLKIKVGHPIAPRRLQEFDTDRELSDYLRLRTYLLGKGTTDRSPSRRQPVPPGKKSQETILAPQNSAIMEDEIRHLPPEQILLESGPMLVIQAEGRQAPFCLLEIGRLRELTFRAVGEGTGRAIDLDRFDNHYLHLFIWNRESREIVGAYRIGQTDRILEHQGVAGLYTSTLFDYQRELLKRLGPSLEMGRSFVRAEYQKNYAPLLLLWKGIGHFVARHPHYRNLFGPVSISSDYSAFSRQLIATGLSQNCRLHELARLVKAKTPLRLRPVRIKGCQDGSASSCWRDLEEISAVIADIEVEQKGVPVLLRHYLNLGGRMLAFNVDPDFSDVLDGLVVVDLAETDQKSLERYLGKDGSRRFLDYHHGDGDRLCA